MLIECLLCTKPLLSVFVVVFCFTWVNLAHPHKDPGASLVAQLVKNLPASAEDARDASSIPGWRRSSGGRNSNLLQHSCLENSMDRGDWWPYSPWGHKESDTTEHACIHSHGRALGDRYYYNS